MIKGEGGGALKKGLIYFISGGLEGNVNSFVKGKDPFS